MSGNGVGLSAIYQAVIALDRRLDRGLTELEQRGEPPETA